jgi:hypothetical protein
MFFDKNSGPQQTHAPVAEDSDLKRWMEHTDFSKSRKVERNQATSNGNFNGIVYSSNNNYDLMSGIRAQSQAGVNRNDSSLNTSINAS